MISLRKRPEGMSAPLLSRPRSRIGSPLYHILSVRHSIVREFRNSKFRSSDDEKPPNVASVNWGMVRDEMDGSLEALRDSQWGHGNGMTSPTTSGAHWIYNPAQAVIGQGAISAAAVQLRKMGFSRALICTDHILERLGATPAVTDALDAVGIEWVIFDKCIPHITVEQVEQGLEVLRDHESNLICSFGGGSTHDLAKALSIVATNPGSILDYVGTDRVKVRPMPVCTINSTNTGAELTRFCTVVDPERRRKLSIIDPLITPVLAVNDPTVHLGMSRSLTAATGMDALSHAIEAYFSTSSTPLTDAAALQSIRLVSGSLRQAVRDGSSIEAREMMCYAAFLAGQAFNSSGLGLVHALAHNLGGTLSLPHGVCTALLLPAVLEFNAESSSHLFIDIAHAMGFHGIEEDPREAVRAVVGEVRRMIGDVGLPRNLRELGLQPSQFEALAQGALEDPCALSAPRPASLKDLTDILHRAYSQ